MGRSVRKLKMFGTSRTKLKFVGRSMANWKSLAALGELQNLKCWAKLKISDINLRKVNIFGIIRAKLKIMGIDGGKLKIFDITPKKLENLGVIWMTLCISR
jgi:hypothetical protein